MTPWGESKKPTNPPAYQWKWEVFRIEDSGSSPSFKGGRYPMRFKGVSVWINVVLG
jgi:hypothetical protein